MSKQELFNTVFSHLWEQGKSSVKGEGTHSYDCLYMSSDGLKCAVGCLISDEYYDESIESHNVTDVKVLHAVERSLNRRVSDAELTLLDNLQKVHDDLVPYNDSPNVWKNIYLMSMYEVANRYDLTLPVLNKTQTEVSV
jgi:hypothetical protein